MLHERTIAERRRIRRDDFEDMDQGNWITAETALGMPTDMQKMKSRAVEECFSHIQRGRIVIAEQLEELERREQFTAAVLGDLSEDQQNVFELVCLGVQVRPGCLHCRPTGLPSCRPRLVEP